MSGRRRFLEVASLGLVSASWGPAGLFAQGPGPKIRAQGRAKSPSKANPPGEGRSLEVDEQVNRILGEARTDGRRLPGMIGAVVRGGDLAHVGAVGLRKIGSPEPIVVDDKVHLGSCTKAMTATMIGTLVDEGKLRWDSTVREVFPEWLERTHPDYSTVTLDQLLGHRAGFPHDLSWWEAGRGRTVVERRRALLSRALQRAPEVRPGSTYSYSNVGYVLAGMMAERVSGIPWETLMRRRLFDPLEMASAGFGPPGTRGRVDHAWGHRATGDLVEAIHDDNDPSMGPAGTVHCSMQDWGKFASFHLKVASGGVPLLKPETFKALHTPKPGEDYAGGWLVAHSGRSPTSGDSLTHNGSNTYWYCTIWLVPSRGVGVLVATNAAGKPAEDACAQAIQGLLRYALPDDRPRRR